MQKVTFVLAPLVAAILFPAPALSRPQQDSPKGKSKKKTP
jgi:hypothetical protein